MTENKYKKNEDEKVAIKLGKVDVPVFDAKKYVGKKAKIGSVETFLGGYGYYLKIQTTPIDMLKGKDGEKELRASRIFGLFTDEAGKTGWGDKGQLVDFMKLKGVKHPDELLGREVMIQLNIKDGKEFLSFI